MAIFEAIGGLLGGLLGNRSGDKRQQQMLQWQEQMDNTKIQRLQKDAKAAGVHPLAAMGASLTSPSPVTVGGRPDYADIGQNVGRAVDATMSSDQKESDYTKTAQALTLEKMQLENDVIKTQLANSAVALVRQPSSPPTYRSAGALLGSSERGEQKRDSLGVMRDILERNWPEADVVNKEYDDLVSSPYGLIKALRDADRLQRPDGTHPLTMRYWRKKLSELKARGNARALLYERKNNRRGVDYGYW